MAQPEAEVFARLLTEAVYRIRIEESKSIQAVQDELGYAIGKSGGASIEHWRKGHIPTKHSDVENLAREIFRRSNLGATWLTRFLSYAGHPDPEWVMQELVPANSAVSAPPPPTPPTDEVIPHNLPSQSTVFIGRETELVEITSQIRDLSCRLLTLVGPGGIGKTRLAVQAAWQERQLFPDGVYFVSLASLTSADFLISTIAQTIHFTFYTVEQPKNQLLNYLREKTMLLILDNFEHLMSEAGFVGEILQTAAYVQVVVTSRERLNLQGEWVFQVKGMSFPKTADSSDHLKTYSAIHLFVQSARRSRAGYVLTGADLSHVIQICRLVEGIPLAIELAAAWVRLLSCEEIAEEIGRSYDFLSTSWRDMPERHRSLQAVFEYSWNLLSEPERRVISWLSVFRGGFVRKAAEFVAETDLFTLSGLVDKSFLSLNSNSFNPRYEMHEHLRLYAAEKLGERPKKVTKELLLPSDKQQVQTQHCRFFTTFLSQCTPRLKGKEQKEALEEIGSEIENVRAAWQWAVEQGNIEAIGQSLKALFYFYEIRSWTQEGEEAFADAVHKMRETYREQPDTASEAILGQLLARQGRFRNRLGLYRQAKELLQESLVILRRLDLPEETVFSINNLGKTAFRLGEYAEARQLCQESVTICQQIGYSEGMITALETLAKVAEELGEYDETRRQHWEGLRICRLLGDKQGIATFLNGLGYIDWRLGEYAEAEQLCQEGLEMYQEVGDRLGVAMCRKNLGNVAADTGDYEQARSQYEQGLKICREIGNQWGIAALLNNLGVIAWEVGSYLEAQRFTEEGLAIQRQIGYQWGVGNSLETLGNIAHALGKWQQSRVYFLEALQIAIDIKALPLILDVLVGLARLLAQDGKPEQAVVVLGCVLYHPAIGKEGNKKGERLWQELTAVLTPQTIETAVAAGKQKSLDEIISVLSEQYPVLSER